MRNNRIGTSPSKAARVARSKVGVTALVACTAIAGGAVVCNVLPSFADATTNIITQADAAKPSDDKSFPDITCTLSLTGTDGKSETSRTYTEFDKDTFSYDLGNYAFGTSPSVKLLAKSATNYACEKNEAKTVKATSDNPSGQFAWDITNKTTGAVYTYSFKYTFTTDGKTTVNGSESGTGTDDSNKFPGITITFNGTKYDAFDPKTYEYHLGAIKETTCACDITPTYGYTKTLVVNKPADGKEGSYVLTLTPPSTSTNKPVTYTFYFSDANADTDAGFSMSVTVNGQPYTKFDQSVHSYDLGTLASGSGIKASLSSSSNGYTLTTENTKTPTATTPGEATVTVTAKDGTKSVYTFTYKMADDSGKTDGGGSNADKTDGDKSDKTDGDKSDKTDDTKGDKTDKTDDSNKSNATDGTSKTSGSTNGPSAAKTTSGSTKESGTTGTSKSSGSDSSKGTVSQTGDGFVQGVIASIVAAGAAALGAVAFKHRHNA